MSYKIQISVSIFLGVKVLIFNNILIGFFTTLSILTTPHSFMKKSMTELDALL